MVGVPWSLADLAGQRLGPQFVKTLGGLSLGQWMPPGLSKTSTKRITELKGFVSQSACILVDCLAKTHVEGDLPDFGRLKRDGDDCLVRLLWLVCAYGALTQRGFRTPTRSACTHHVRFEGGHKSELLCLLIHGFS